MTVLSRMAKLGIAAEPSPADYQPPAFTVIHSAGTTYRQVITPLRDSALRGSDSWLEDLQQGPVHSEWLVKSDGYADLAGWYLRAVIGPDACTPGVATTLTAAAAEGASALATAAAVPSGAVLMIGAGDTLEYAQARSTSAALASPLRFAHLPGEPVLSQATHVFGQETGAGFPTFSLTMDDGTGPLGWPGCTMSALQVTITPGGYVKFRASWSGFPAAPVTTFDWAATPEQPMAGWDWAITQGSSDLGLIYHAGVAGPVVRPLDSSSDVAAASTRGQALDLKLTRKLAVGNTVCGQQAPYGIWPGPLKADAAYQAIYENADDMDLFLEYIQDPVSHVVAQPVLLGGSSLAIGFPRAGWLEGAADDSGDYLSAKYSISGIATPFAGPLITATLTNYAQSAYLP
jgi:hypothetical protein